MDNKKKKILIFSAIAVLILLLIIVIIMILNKEESYRIVKIYELDGTATVTREDTGEIEIYPNMVLASGDEVYLKEGLMTLKLDEDKYVYVEEDTRFSLVAQGNASNSKTSIELKQGAIINEIRSPLPQDASYEVHTQNSSMSVRGTTFRVAVYYDENGTLFTKVSVFDGKVETQLVYKDGTKADPRMIEYGKETIIFEDDTNTDYLEGITDIKYEELSVQALKTLLKLVKEGLVLSISEEELSEIISLLTEEDSTILEEEPKEDTTDDSQQELTDSTEEEDTEDAGQEKKKEETPSDQTQPSAPTDNGQVTPPGSDDTDATEEEKGPYTVTFKYNGTVFATQTVENGKCATKPSLMPAKSGDWDFDFSTAITVDTTINWN